MQVTRLKLHFLEIYLDKEISVDLVFENPISVSMPQYIIIYHVSKPVKCLKIEGIEECLKINDKRSINPGCSDQP